MYRQHATAAMFLLANSPSTNPSDMTEASDLSSVPTHQQILSVVM